MKKLVFIVPLALFAVLVFFLGRGLKLDPHELPSPLIDKPAPAFALKSALRPGTKGESTTPGDTVMTRTSGASARARDLPITSRPAFDAT